MKSLVRSVLFLAFIAIATQDITGRKGCDCSICNGADNKLNPIVGKGIGLNGGGKSGCSICERKKELLRLERERQRQLQKCPFEILGSPSVKGKTSEEVFDEFRELIVPSQNGFFDMMRGIVRTMHVSSETELKWAREKEAKELAKKKKQEAEEAKRRKESKSSKEEMVGLNNPVSPKVTVVLKQTPCGSILQPTVQDVPEKITLMQRLPKEVSGDGLTAPEEEVSYLQSVHLANDQATEGDNLDLNSKGSLYSFLINRLIGYESPTTMLPKTEEMKNEGRLEEIFSTVGKDTGLLESTTESPFVKFISNDEMRAFSARENFWNDFDMGMNVVQPESGVDMQQVDEGNAQSIHYSVVPISL